MIAKLIIFLMCFYFIDSTSVRRPCKEHERYTTCLRYCAVTRCSQLSNTPVCIPEHNCTAGWECIDGYLYNDKGFCIPEKECPRCPINEVYGILPYCTVTECSQIPNPPMCVPEHPKQRKGCKCVDNYLRDNGTCIPKEKCKPKCGSGEVYNPCAWGCQPTCAQQPRDCPIQCESLCVCDKHKFRNSQWKCVNWDQCTASDKNGGGGDSNGVPESNYGGGDPNAVPEGSDDGECDN